jgi:alpha-glucuronidase
VDAARFEHVAALLDVQLREARWWRAACLLYFQSLSRLPFPPDIDPPEGRLADYLSHRDYYVPGI